jgi:MobA/MobL family
MSGAIYHVSVSTRTKATSSGGGGSAGATAEYISRLGDYGRSPGEVLHLESGNMPKWAARAKSDVAKRIGLAYWHATDAYERCNGRLAKVIIIALPRALSLKAQVGLSKAIARKLTSEIDGGCLPWTLAIHAGLDAQGQSRNPHCHIMVGERVNDGIERSPALWFRRASVRLKGKVADPASGGARKTTALRPRAWLLWVREIIAKLINLALRTAGLSFRVDHRSNASRGLVRVPQPKLGPCAAWLEKQDIRTSRGDDVLHVMRSWTGPNPPSGPILAVRQPQVFQMDAGVSPHSKRGPMYCDFAAIPRPEPVSTQRRRPELEVIRPRRILRPSLPSAGPRVMIEQVATRWWLVVVPLDVAHSDSDAACKRLAYPDYEQHMLKWFGHKLLAVTFRDSPEPHRLLLFTDGTRVRDYGQRIEMIGIAGGSVPSVPTDLVTRGKGWSAVRVAGSEPTRRLVCRDLLLGSVRVEDYTEVAQDLATMTDVERTNDSTRDTPEDLSQYEGYSPHSFGPG